MNEKIEEVFISYGLGNYDENKFNPIENIKSFNIKPKGGLWCSPVNSSYGWRDWCEAEEFVKGQGFSNYFKFNLKDMNRVYKINSFFDLLLFPYKIKTPGQNYIDYEEAAKHYDAIWLTEEGQRETRLPELNGLYDIDGSNINLYGWDCESLLILNKEAIINVQYFTEP